MISRADLNPIIERQAVQGSPVLSVYLDVDQGKTTNLKRGFETSLKNMLRSIEAPLDKAQLKNFSADANRVEQFVSVYEPKAKGLTMFCDSSEGLFWTREINVLIENNTRWSDAPHFLPLLQLMDEHERYGVTLGDKTHARVFTVFMGEIEAHGEVHAQRVAEQLEHVVDRQVWDRLLLAGHVEATGELYHLLSKRVRRRVAARLNMPIEAGEHEVLEETLRVESDVERQAELDLVEELIADKGDQHITLGLERTLRALAEVTIWRLVYSSGFKISGGRCPNCAMLFPRTDGPCDYCSTAIKPVEDFVEQMVKQVLDGDGQIEEVAGPAAAALQKVGGIGAVLRF
ncbi:MAG TPA: hypothetical protein VE422_44375 [Terriglobia bacterium]|nr:hypothetical protein [Terriglobia bacterium]